MSEGNVGVKLKDTATYEVRFETHRCVEMRLQPGLGPGPLGELMQRSLDP